MAVTKNVIIISMIVMALCWGVAVARNSPKNSPPPSKREPPAETDSISTVQRQVVWIQSPSGETDCDSSPVRPQKIVQIHPVVTKD